MSKRIDREGPYHRAILRHLHMRLPGAVIHHSPNEFPGKGDAIARAIAKAKKNGMVVGFPDLVVFWRGQVALIEVKAPGGKLSASQVVVSEQFAGNGFSVHVITDPDEAAAIADDMHRAASDWQPIGEIAGRIVRNSIQKPEAAE